MTRDVFLFVSPAKNRFDGLFCSFFAGVCIFVCVCVYPFLFLLTHPVRQNVFLQKGIASLISHDPYLPQDAIYRERLDDIFSREVRVKTTTWKSWFLNPSPQNHAGRHRAVNKIQGAVPSFVLIPLNNNPPATHTLRSRPTVPFQCTYLSACLICQHLSFMT